MKILLTLLSLLTLNVAAHDYRYTFNDTPFNTLVPIVQVSEHNIMYGGYDTYNISDHVYVQTGLQYNFDERQYIVLKTEMVTEPIIHGNYHIDTSSPTLILEFKITY